MVRCTTAAVLAAHAATRATCGKRSYISTTCSADDAPRRAGSGARVLGDVPDRAVGLQQDPAVIVVAGGESSRGAHLTAAGRCGSA